MVIIPFFLKHISLQPMSINIDLDVLAPTIPQSFPGSQCQHEQRMGTFIDEGTLELLGNYDAYSAGN